MRPEPSSRRALAVLGTYRKPDPSLPHGTLHSGHALLRALLERCPDEEVDIFSNEQIAPLPGLSNTSISRVAPALLPGRTGRYRAIYVTNGHQMTGVPHLLRPSEDWAPVICQMGTTHQADQWKNLLVARMTRAIRPQDGLIFKSRSAYEAFARTWTRWSSLLSTTSEIPRHVVIPNGLDTHHNQRSPDLRDQARNQLGLGRDDVCFLAFSRLSPGTKGDLLALVSLWSRIRRQAPNAVLVLAGAAVNQDFAHSLRVAARLEKTSDQVLIVENPSDLWPDARASLMSAADAFIHLSTGVEEASSLVVHEAQSHALPLIATDWAGLREIVQEGENGWLLPTYVHHIPPRLSTGLFSDDAAASNIGLSRLACAVGAELISLVCRLARAPHLLRRAGEVARSMAVHTFDSRLIAGRHLDFIRELSSAAAGSGAEGLPRMVPLVEAEDILLSQARHRLAPHDRLAVVLEDPPPVFMPHCFAGMPLPAADRLLATLVRLESLSVADFMARARESLATESPASPDTDVESAASAFMLRLIDYGVLRVESGRGPPIDLGGPLTSW